MPADATKLGCDNMPTKCNVRAGQLRTWISRDESGGIHETIQEDPYFIITTDPYVDGVGMSVVDYLEGGKVYVGHAADDLEYWSLVIND